MSGIFIKQQRVRDLRGLLAQFPDELPVFFESIQHYAGMYTNIQPVYRAEEIEWIDGQNGPKRGVLIRAHYQEPLEPNLTVKTEV
jgi:hypothetical protein